MLHIKDVQESDRVSSSLLLLLAPVNLVLFGLCLFLFFLFACTFPIESPAHATPVTLDSFDAHPPHASYKKNHTKHAKTDTQVAAYVTEPRTVPNASSCILSSRPFYLLLFFSDGKRSPPQRWHLMSSSSSLPLQNWAQNQGAAGVRLLLPLLLPASSGPLLKLVLAE